jgi:1-deoxy-D-xylulose-5-phosphate synthase
VAAGVVLEEMNRDESIVAITPSTIYATGLGPVFERFPERCFDPGMEEQHALSMTVGMALEGKKPVIAYQSTFLQRAFDQLLHDVCFTNLPTLILSTRSGFAGYDNPTHHGIYDMGWMRALPNLRVLYPKDRFEAERMVRDELRGLSGPVAILLPYGPAPALDESIFSEARGCFMRPQVVQEGRELLVVAVGNKYPEARAAVLDLRARGVDAGLVNLRQVKPLPEEDLVPLLRRSKRVVTVEEAVLDGGVGSAMASLVLDRNLGCAVLRVGLPCVFVEPGSNDELCRAFGLDADGILARIGARWPELDPQFARSA